MLALTFHLKKILMRARVHRNRLLRKRIISHLPRVIRTRRVRIPRIRLPRPLIKRRVLPSSARSRASSVVKVATSPLRKTLTLVPRISATHAVALGILRASARLVLRKKPQTRVQSPLTQICLIAGALASCFQKP